MFLCPDESDPGSKVAEGSDLPQNAESSVRSYALYEAAHLSQPDHEEVVGVLGVVLGQLPQHGGQTGVVCAWSNGEQSRDGKGKLSGWVRSSTPR